VELDATGEALLARRVVLTTGVRDVFPQVQGFFEHYGADLFHCPTCDGFDARGRCVAVFGWAQHVAGFAAELLDWAAEVRGITNGERFESDDEQRAALAEHGVEVIEDRVVELLGPRGALRGLGWPAASGPSAPWASSPMRMSPKPPWLDSWAASSTTRATCASTNTSRRPFRGSPAACRGRRPRRTQAARCDAQLVVVAGWRNPPALRRTITAHLDVDRPILLIP
jgi:hypothetical protein